MSEPGRQPGPAVPEPPASSTPGRNSEQLRARYREQTLASIGGWSGTVVTAIPTVVFVAVNIVAPLRTAVAAAVATAIGLALYRLARRQPVSQAVSGLIGVLVAAMIANATGQARNYFLVGILSSFAYGLVLAGSMVVRRPLVGLAWEFLDPSAEHQVWHRRPELLRAYQLATAAGVVLFLSRGLVQLLLYLRADTTWLGVARVLMGYPLWLAALLFAFWVVRRARHRLSGTPAPPA